VKRAILQFEVNRWRGEVFRRINDRSAALAGLLAKNSSKKQLTVPRWHSAGAKGLLTMLERGLRADRQNRVGPDNSIAL
jgi:hypothetical protein